MFMPPRCASLAIFADDNSEPYARTAVTVLAALTEFHQSLAQLIANRNRSRWRAATIFWRNNEPSSIRPLSITSVLIIPIATRMRLALCPDGSAGYTTNDRTSRCPSAAAYCAANDGPGSAAQDCAAYWVLRGRVLYRHRKCNGQKG
jgi:hypothetical protein